MATQPSSITRSVRTTRPVTTRSKSLSADLILFTDRLGVGLSVRVEEFLSALLPCRLEFGSRDVPVRPAFLRHSAQVLAHFFHSGAAEEPVAVADLIDDKTWFEDDRVAAPSLDTSPMTIQIPSR